MSIYSIDKLMEVVSDVGKKAIHLDLNIQLQLAPGEEARVLSKLTDTNMANITDAYMQEVFVPDWLKKQWDMLARRKDSFPQLAIPSVVSAAFEEDPMEGAEEWDREVDIDGHKTPVWELGNPEDPYTTPNKRRMPNLMQNEESKPKRSQHGKNVKASGDMRDGFRAAWSVLSTSKKITGGGISGAGIGPRTQLLGLSLRRFMGEPGFTKSPLNTLWYAIEFGTGIAENVGGEQFVNKSGDYKLGAPFKSGTWRWYDNDDNPYYFEGQKGFHLLYDETTRAPRAVHAEFVAKTYGEFFSKKFHRLYK